MQTAIAEPVRSVTVNGVAATSAMTPTEIFNAHLTAQGGTPIVERPQHNGNGPPLGYQTPATVQRLAQGDGVPAAPGTIAGKAPPPAPKVLEASNNNIEAFDAEMRAKGLQRTDMATQPGEVNHEAVELIGKRYISLMRGVTNEEQAARHKASYEKDLKSLYEGKQLTEAQMTILRRAAAGGNGEGTSFMPKAKAAPAPAPTAAPVATWQQHVQDGQVDLDKITTADTSGYTLQRFVKNQTLRAEAFDMLKNAKAAGFSQQQIDSYFRQDAINLGWVKQ